MSSPFQRYANLTVVFQQPTGTPEIANDLGTPALSTSDLIAAAWVQQQQGTGVVQSYGQPLQDGELSRLSYQGRWVLPMQAPQTLMAEQVGPAIIWRLAPDFALPVAGWSSVAEYEAFVAANESRIGARGDFVLAPNPPGPFGVEAKTGDLFGGYLITQVAWADAL